MPSRRFVCRLAAPPWLVPPFDPSSSSVGEEAKYFSGDSYPSNVLSREGEGRKPRPGPGLHQCPALLPASTDRQEAQMRGKKSVGVRRGEYAKQNAPRPRDEEYMQPASSGFT